MIPHRAATILSGAGSVGKTLLLLQAEIAAAARLPWLGGAVRSGPALFFSAEDALEEIQIRVDEIAEAENIGLDRLNDLHVMNLSDERHAALLAHDKKTGLMVPTSLYERLVLTIREVRPVITCLDNRALIIAGNENDRDVASQSMRILNLLARDTNQAVVMAAHPSVSGANSRTGQSGSTGWFAGGRAAGFLERPKAGERRRKISTAI